MSHFTDTDEHEPDYVFVVNKDRSEVFLNQLKNAFISSEKCVTTFQSSENPAHTIVVIYFPGDMLD
jgi:hypothetical protein